MPKPRPRSDSASHSASSPPPRSISWGSNGTVEIAGVTTGIWQHPSCTSQSSSRAVRRKQTAYGPHACSAALATSSDTASTAFSATSSGTSSLTNSAHTAARASPTGFSTPGPQVYSCRDSGALRPTPGLIAHRHAARADRFQRGGDDPAPGGSTLARPPEHTRPRRTAHSARARRTVAETETWGPPVIAALGRDHHTPRSNKSGTP